MLMRMLALRPGIYTSIPRPVIPWNTTPPPPAEPKPSMWEWYKSLQGPQQPTPMESAVTGLRHNAEGLAVGAVLGFVKGEFGTLDIQGRFPVDGIAAFLLYLMSIRDAGKPDGFASDLRALSQSCSTIFAFRKAEEWREASKGLNPSSNIPRNIDPIKAAAEANGLYKAA